MGEIGDSGAALTRMLLRARLSAFVVLWPLLRDELREEGVSATMAGVRQRGWKPQRPGGWAENKMLHLGRRSDQRGGKVKRVKALYMVRRW